MNQRKPGANSPQPQPTPSRAEIFRQDYARLTQQQETVKSFWHPKEGDNIIRILPYGGTSQPFYIRFYRHFLGAQERRSVICRKTYGEDEYCPACEAVELLRQRSDVESRRLASEVRRRERFAFNILDMNEETRRPMVWEVGARVFEAILSLFLDPEYQDIDSPVRGRNIKIYRTGRGRNDTRYSVRPAATPSQIPQEVLSQVINLQELFKVPSVDEMLEQIAPTALGAILSGETSEAFSGESQEEWSDVEEDEEEEETAPVEEEAEIPQDLVRLRQTSFSPISETQAPPLSASETHVSSQDDVAARRLQFIRERLKSRR